MSLPRYEKYKHSGVEWLGEVPEGWEVKPFYCIASERDESNQGMVENNLLSLSYGRIVTKDIAANDGLLPESFETYQIVRPGDIVFRLTDLQNDKRSLRTAIVCETGIITSAYVATTPTFILPSYLNYLLRAYDETKVFYSMGGGLRQSMKFSDLKRLPTVFPPLPEQQTIAAFLDRETGKIDALVAEQERLIDLLKEKRQAVISHAVTKGLDPDAPMNNSGIEWLGEVPVGWEVAALKRFCKLITDGAHVSPETENGVYSFVSTKDIRDNIIDFESCLKTSESSFEYLVMTGCRPYIGDVLFSKDGTIGRTVVVRQDVDFVVASSLIIIRPDDMILNSEYLNYLCISNVVASQVEGFVKGAGLPRLSIQNLLKVIGVFPSTEEQAAIATLLDSETAKIDTLIAEAQQAISLLKERRSALISAAVTGKIDVRNMASTI